MSRDAITNYFESEQQARDYFDKVVAGYQPGVDRFGYVLWFADLRDPNSEVKAHANGYPYGGSHNERRFTIILALIAIFGPFLFGALSTAARIRRAKRKARTFRQFPTFFVDDGEDEGGR